MILVRFAFAMNVEKHVLLMHTTSAAVSRTRRDAAHRQHSAILCAKHLFLVDILLYEVKSR